eukprot:8809700-Pyramimonas_sp.AAC.2
MFSVSTRMWEHKLERSCASDISGLNRKSETKSEEPLPWYETFDPEGIFLALANGSARTVRRANDTECTS